MLIYIFFGKATHFFLNNMEALATKFSPDELRVMTNNNFKSSNFLNISGTSEIFDYTSIKPNRNSDITIVNVYISSPDLKRFFFVLKSRNYFKKVTVKNPGNPFTKERKIYGVS